MDNSLDAGAAGVGVHIATRAVLLDAFAGHAPPRHLYSSATWRVWGNLPYAPSDFWTHGVLDTLYPGYEAASFYHDERGTRHAMRLQPWTTVSALCPQLISTL